MLHSIKIISRAKALHNELNMKQYIVSEDKLISLLEAERKLNNLEACGVDNWDGYECIFDEEFSDITPWTPESVSRNFKELEKVTK